MTTYAMYMCTTVGVPSLEEVADQIGIGADNLDPHFGVVPIQPLDDGAWRVAVRIDQRLATDLAETALVEGPFADPPIEPAGPPSSHQQPKEQT